MTAKWNSDNIPDQNGRSIIITGANSGIGYWTALHLARKGAHVVLARRGEKKHSKKSWTRFRQRPLP